MNLFTPVTVAEPSVKIQLKDSIITVGSCFSDVLGHFFHQYKRPSHNPFGTVYNSSSIAFLIEYSLDLKPLSDKLMTSYHELWFHYLFHSRWRAQSSIALKQLLENNKLHAKSNFLNANWLIITLGTSWVYKHIETGEWVNNCHKQSTVAFEKTFLTPQLQVDVLQNALQSLRKINPDIKIIFTISPVRHIKDGFFENNRSKGTLFEVVHQLLSIFKNSFYFPAYEILLDELRDYRYFSNDLIHPNSLAEKYILERFITKNLSSDFQNFITDWDKIQADLNHIPFNPHTDEHQYFLKKLYSKILKYETEMNVKTELEKIIAQIKN